MNALLAVVILALALLVLTLLGVLAWRERRAAALRRVAGQLEGLVRSGQLTRRLSTERSGGLAASINRLLDQVAQRERQLALREGTLADVLGGLEQALAVHGERLLFVNQRFASLLGHGGHGLTGRTLVEQLPAQHRASVAQCLEDARSNEGGQAAVQLPSLAGSDEPALQFTAQRIDYQGTDALLLTLAPCASVMESPDERVAPNARQTLDCLGEAVLTTDTEARIDYLNHAGEQVLGVDVSQALGRTLLDLVSLQDEADRRTLDDPVQDCLVTGMRVSLGRRGVMISRQNGQERSVELTVTPLKDSEGVLIGTVIVLRDVSELRGYTRQMSYQASHDALTGLVNRREFEHRLQGVLNRAHAGRARHALCYLDLDRFKVVNDSCGHLAGDAMLREVATLIKGAVRDADTVARLGGDEFGMLLVGCPLTRARELADEVVRRISEHRFVWQDRIFDIGVSIGLLELSHESGAPEEVMSAADSACYVAKRRGNHVHVYSARDEAVARHRGEIHWLLRLQTALKDNRFVLLGQPVVALDECTHDGPALEVLLRMQDEAVPGGISPVEFLRAAERYRLMGEVDRWVVRSALTALSMGTLPQGRALAINLSGQTLADPGFLEFVVQELDRTGVAPAGVMFEVSEQAVMINVEHAQRFIAVLHGMGCKFALDDFGRGLSSFGTLKHLALDYLKIDGSFIRTLAQDDVNQAMVTAMIKLARTLEFQVIAEQVEDEASLACLRQMGVDFVQGFHLGRPQPLRQALGDAGGQHEAPRQKVISG